MARLGVGRKLADAAQTARGKFALLCNSEEARARTAYSAATDSSNTAMSVDGTSSNKSTSGCAIEDDSESDQWDDDDDEDDDVDDDNEVENDACEGSGEIVSVVSKRKNKQTLSLKKRSIFRQITSLQSIKTRKDAMSSMGNGDVVHTFLHNDPFATRLDTHNPDKRVFVCDSTGTFSYHPIHIMQNSWKVTYKMFLASQTYAEWQLHYQYPQEEKLAGGVFRVKHKQPTISKCQFMK